MIPAPSPWVIPSCSSLPGWGLRLGGAEINYLLCTLSAFLTPRICEPCCCSITKSCATLCDAMNCSTPGSPVLHYLPVFAQIHVHWVSDAIWSSHPLWPLLPLPSVFPSIGVFSNELALCIRWPKYCSFSFSNSSFNEYSGSLSFQIDWFGLLAVHASLTALALGLCYTAVVNQREHPRHQGWVEMVHQLSPSLWLWDCTGHENSQSFHFFIWNNNSSLLKYRNEVRNQWRPSFYETECLWNNAAMKSKWLVLLTSPSVNWRVALWIMKDMLWEK